VKLVNCQALIDEVNVTDSQRVADRLGTAGEFQVTQEKGSECVHTCFLNGMG
jgi:hypothetical protein